MEELFIIGIIIGAVVSLMLTAVLLRLGVMIDRFPVSNEGERDRSLWSPVEFTRISVIFYWPLYIIGGYMVFQPVRIMLIGGITLLFGLFLFLVTAMLFSAAVYNLLRSKNRESGMPAPVPGLMGTSTRIPSLKLLPSLKMRTSGK
ncbi:MAG: hypothetical protein GKC06_02795 [Methanomicrobiales archaeon]|nr:hypothetical protein [Methanomicrobiales archaeon]NYT20504.1 hypothetical protein [Methanomicrobiales archaeon]